MARRWTEFEVARLKSIAKRLPAPKIAEKMDRSVGAIECKARQLGLLLRTDAMERKNLSSPDPGAAGFDW